MIGRLLLGWRHRAADERSDGRIKRLEINIIIIRDATAHTCPYRIINVRPKRREYS